MRKRNIKINVFLNEKENLKLNAKKLKLSQAEYIRNLIMNDGKENYQSTIQISSSKQGIIDINNVIKILDKNIECLVKIRNKFHYLGYFKDEQAIAIKIETLKILNDTVRKNLKNNKNPRLKAWFFS